MSARTLVFVLHAFDGSPAKMAHVKAATEACIPGVRVITPRLPLGKFSFADPCKIVERLLEDVDQEWKSGGYDRIILVGHSMGSLLARKLYLAACGSNSRAPLEANLSKRCASPRPWAGSVERIVLLAGMNNGWSIDHHMALGRVIGSSIGVALGRIAYLFRRRWPVIFSTRRGASFLTQLRLQWLVMRRAASNEMGCAPVIQLLGSVDDLVSPHDNVDLVTGQDFYFLDVPKSGHTNVIEMDVSREGVKRAEIYQAALTLTEAELREKSVPVFDVNPIAPAPEVDEVVFVIHGIRDQGYWTEKIARAVIQEARASHKRFAQVTSTYGYFGMLPFLFPWKRRQKVEWLMDKYVEAVARYPKASRFHYVGHSNGTYLLAKALQDYPCCLFNRVVFAGSVVRTKYDWVERLKSAPKQVDEVLNYTATSDWVVAYFPNCFEYFGIQDLGGAGHSGFKVNRELSDGSVANVGYIEGEHSAALIEDNWDAIAKYVVNGYKSGIPLSNVEIKRSHGLIVGILGRFPPLVWVLIAALLCAGPAMLIYGLFRLGWAEWFVTASLIGYFASIWYVGNRV